MDLSAFKVLVPPAVLGVIFQLIKPILEKFVPNHNWYPLIVAMIGIVANLIWAFLGGTVLELVIGGIMAGLVSAGGYDLINKTILGNE